MKGYLYYFTVVGGQLFLCGMAVLAAVRCKRKPTWGRGLFLFGLLLSVVMRAPRYFHTWVYTAEERAAMATDGLLATAALLALLGTIIAILSFLWLTFFEKD